MSAAKPDRMCGLNSVTQCGNRVPKKGKGWCEKCTAQMLEANRTIAKLTRESRSGQGLNPRTLRATAIRSRGKRKGEKLSSY